MGLSKHLDSGTDQLTQGAPLIQVEVVVVGGSVEREGSRFQHDCLMQ